MRISQRSSPRWRSIYAALNREARVPGGKELALGLALLGPAAPITQADPQTAARPQHPVGWEHYEDSARAAAEKNGVPADMFLRLLRVENPEGDPLATNPRSGATGLGQFMPETAAEFGTNPHDPQASIESAARYLKQLYREFGDWEHSVMAYNWGPGNVRKWLSSDDAEMPAETAAYIARIEP